MIDEDEHTPVYQPGALLQGFNIAVDQKEKVMLTLCRCIEDWVGKNWFGIVSKTHLKLLLSM